MGLLSVLSDNNYLIILATGEISKIQIEVKTPRHHWLHPKSLKECSFLPSLLYGLEFSPLSVKVCQDDCTDGKS